MNPVNNPNSYPAAYISGQITWNGKAIPCLGICSGDKLNNVVYLIATKICELTEPTDLSSLTLQCALDIFNRDEIGNRTLTSVLQLLIDNECDLKTLIDTIEAQIANLREPTLILNLGCLLDNYVDQFGNALPYTTQSILQDLITKICSLESSIVAIGSGLASLTTTVTNHIANHPVPEEVNITTCISNSQTPVSQAVIALAADYCAWKNFVGTTAHIQTAISRQTADINTQMAGVTGWIVNPVTLAQSLNNAWLYEKFNSDRLSVIENNCCKITCKDVLVGFNIIVNSDGNGISLSFTSVAGTDIPGGFADMGSVLTIKDKNGLTAAYNIEITQDGTVGDFSIVGFDTSENLTASVQALIGNSSLQCQKCLSKQFTVADNSCCVITNGGSDDITIVYTT